MAGRPRGITHIVDGFMTVEEISSGHYTYDLIVTEMFTLSR
jgi:hypothetical protein